MQWKTLRSGFVKNDWGKLKRKIHERNKKYLKSCDLSCSKRCMERINLKQFKIRIFVVWEGKIGVGSNMLFPLF
jgi:hypothetical protein